jgi:hypothetical protein
MFVILLVILYYSTNGTKSPIKEEEIVEECIDCSSEMVCKDAEHC